MLGLAMSKQAKKRDCPALGAPMSAAECGERRVSQLACPASCRFNPFALEQYDEFLELEARAYRDCRARLFQDLEEGEAAMSRLRNLPATTRPDELNALMVWHFFCRRGRDGRTAAGRWEEVGWTGLNNDGRVLLKAMSRVHLVLLEVHRVFDAQRIEAVDLLDPAPVPLLIVDRGLASSLNRFDVVLTWLYSLPHYWRVSGVALPLPEFQGCEPLEVVRAIVRHLGGPLDEAPMRFWLTEHFKRYEESLTATIYARRKAMFEAADAIYGTVDYDFQAPLGDCRARLDEVDSVDEDPPNDAERKEGFGQGRVWFDDVAKPLVPEGGRVVLGRVLLAPTRCRLLAMGGERTSRLRRQFEEWMGDRVRFVREQRDDLVSRLSKGEPDFDPTLVPPVLLQATKQFSVQTSRVDLRKESGPRDQLSHEFHARYLRQYADLPIPLLDGKTPREASVIPALRPKLLRLMKSLVRDVDEKNLRTGRSDDINWLLRELGLTEILFDPPPFRPPPRPGANEPGEWVDEYEASAQEDIVNLPDPARLTGPPWSFAEAQKRLRQALKDFPEAKGALDALHRSAPHLVEDCFAILEERLNEAEAALFLILLTQVAFCFCPPGTRHPSIDFDVLADSFENQLRNLEGSLRSGDPSGMDRLFEASCQPELVTILAASLFQARKGIPKKHRPRLESQVHMMAMLEAVVEQLDAALRK